MKKKIAGLALVTLLVIGQASSIFAAGSSTIGGVGQSSKTTTTTTTTTTASTNAVKITEPVVDDTTLSFATDAAATAGLPSTTVSQINAINSGSALSDNIKDVNLSGYSSLIPTVAVVTRSTATGAVNDTVTVPVKLYIPNLVAGLNNVQILYYNNSTGRWELLTPTSVDAASKTLTVNVKGSGTLTVVYKK